MFKIIRRKIGRLNRRVTHQFFPRSAPPPVLCNSFPKSGTYLLIEIVGSIAPFRYYGGMASWYCLNRNRVELNKRYSINDVLQKLKAILPGEIIRGHVEAQPDLVQFLAQSNVKHIFIYRDLRDVVISQFFYWEKGISADRWPFRYFKTLKNKEDKISFLITGWPFKTVGGDFPDEVDYPNISERFLLNLAWLSNENCLAVRYEDLISLEKRRAGLNSIAKFLLNTDDPNRVEAAVRDMEGGFDPSRSKTFRSGKTGEWRKYFSAEHVKLFKKYAGNTLITLGYEKDLNW